MADKTRPLVLNPEAVTRWIARLRHFFPGLDRFDRPDPDFDASERDYKLETAQELRASLKVAKTDQDIVDAVHAALIRSNLLPWRAFWPMSPKGNANRALLWPALEELAQAALDGPDAHPPALEKFVTAWEEAAPDGRSDQARQIGEFLFMHLFPDQGIYIRHNVRQKMWSEALGGKFPDDESMARIYDSELRFMQAVRQAFEDHGLAPRDMIDVQSALWVVHSYKDEDMDDMGLRNRFSREEVERAMNAYDKYRGTGAHGEIFEHFGDPRDYWVRSTRDRENRVYPTKPIVGFVMNKTDLNGGWTQKHDAAARLHNAGFLIVDDHDHPVAPPKQSEHLEHGADRIRHHALNYYIDPARERDDAQVTIHAGTVHDALCLENSWANVCQSLAGAKFQESAKVPPPERQGPEKSTTTAFTYHISQTTKVGSMNEEKKSAPETTNLILYGPPGTGKTFETAWEAVRLCLGDQAAEPFRDAQNRKKLMAEYRRLVEDKRIEFVTFHQSFSYEDFVEGLRPTTDKSGIEGEAVETSASVGFRLETHSGVFKHISERARLDTGDAVGQRLDRTKNVFKLSLIGSNYRQALEASLEQRRMFWGFGGRVNWSASEFDEFDAIKEQWLKDHPDASGQKADVSGTWYFRAAVEKDDYVVLTVGKNKIVALGKVTGSYEFIPENEQRPHAREVEWIWYDPNGADRSRFYPERFNAFQPMYRLRETAIDWDGLENIAFRRDATRPTVDARDYVLIIDEINRANISKVFGELISLLEPDKRLGCDNEIRLRLPYSGRLFGVPANLHIIGTMNTADRSIALLDTALRRRFRFRELMPKPELLSTNVGGIDLRKMLTLLNDRIEYYFDREHQIGHAYFIDCESRANVEESRANVEQKMRDSIIPLLAEYFYEDWSRIAAVLEGRPVQAEEKLDGRFLKAERLLPHGIRGEDEEGGVRWRWSVQDTFDFSEFKPA